MTSHLRRGFQRLAIWAQRGSRDTKWLLYERAFPPRRGESVLDVGVSALDDLPGENYFLRSYPYPDQVTAVGIDDLNDLARRYPSVTFIQADGRALPFEDGAFDVVHCNAVIEHVGAEEDQRLLVAELVRVAHGGLVTTPNRWFPIETHCRLPFLHWLPRPLVFRLSRLLREPGLHWWLLGRGGMRRMFPSTVELELERTKVFGWPLTIVAIFSRQ
jgi:hypothetical protein